MTTNQDIEPLTTIQPNRALRRKSRRLAAAGLLVAVGLTFTACSDDDGDSTDIDNPVDGVDDQVDDGAEDIEENIDSETDDTTDDMTDDTTEDTTE